MWRLRVWEEGEHKAMHLHFASYPPPLPSKKGAPAHNATRLGTDAIFRARTEATQPPLVYQLDRRERIVLLLLDGKRTIQNVADLIHRDELEVARILVRLLKQGYVDFIGPQATQNEH